MRRCGFIARSILINLWYVIIILSCGDWQFSRRPACDGPSLQRPSMARRRQSMVKWLHDLHLTHPLGERPACPWQGKNISRQGASAEKGTNNETTGLYDDKAINSLMLFTPLGLWRPRKTHCPQAEGEYISSTMMSSMLILNYKYVLY